jgi:hypothetical protein
LIYQIRERKVPYIIKKLNVLKMKNVTEKKASNKVKNTNKSMLVKKGNEIHVAENVTSKKLKVLTSLQESKRDYKKEANDIRNSLATNLRILKDECKKGENFVKELNTKYSLSITSKEVFLLLCKPMNFAPFLTEAQLVKFSENRLNFTPSLIIEAMAKYFKATYKASK